MVVSLYDDGAALDRARRKIQKMDISQANKKLLLDFGEDCLAGKSQNYRNQGLYRYYISHPV